jgi:hypothetical protein
MTLQIASLDTVGEKRSFDHGQLHIITLGDATIGRAVFNPGWRWSTDVKPAAGTDSCQVAHTGVVLSGRFHVRMDDGTEADLGPGDAHVVPPGHDAWVVGDEQCVTIDIAHGTAGGTMGGRVGRCPCGVEFRVATDEQLDHLVAAIREHAKGSHDHELTREQVLAELGVPEAA